MSIILSSKMLARKIMQVRDRVGDFTYLFNNTQIT